MGSCHTLLNYQATPFGAALHHTTKRSSEPVAEPVAKLVAELVSELVSERVAELVAEVAPCRHGTFGFALVGALAQRLPFVVFLLALSHGNLYFRLAVGKVDA